MTCMMVKFHYKKAYLNFLVKQDPFYYQTLNKFKAILKSIIVYSLSIILFLRYVPVCKNKRPVVTSVNKIVIIK